MKSDFQRHIKDRYDDIEMPVGLRVELNTLIKQHNKKTRLLEQC